MATATYTSNGGDADTALVTPASLLAAAETALADARSFISLSPDSPIMATLAAGRLSAAELLAGRAFAALAAVAGCGDDLEASSQPAIAAGSRRPTAALWWG